jgi:Domain of unknown function (DUF5025)
MKQKIFLLTSVLLTLISCNKSGIPDLTLPAITETGQNTLGFIIDNKVWTNYGRRCTIAGCNDNKVSASLYKQNGGFDLEITAEYTISSETIDQLFEIYARDITTTGTFSLDSNLNRGMTFVASRYNQSYKEYNNKSINKCFLTITKIDTTSKIISGIFNGVLYNSSNLNDSTKIELGRFDAKLNYIK